MIRAIPPQKTRIAAVLLALIALNAAKAEVIFEKHVLDTTFRSEGVAIADVNRDGLPDILAGDVWYEAPTWKMHEMQAPGAYNPNTGYSNTFSNYTADINNDGWIDSITTTMMGQPCHWFENPKNATGHWKKHIGAPSACNETPLFADLFGNGKPVPLFGVQPGGYIAWFSVTDKPESLWTMHTIAGPKAPGSEQFSHGLGVGDIDGDGRNDVLVTTGWWQAPEDRTQENWKFHPANLGPGCADMLVYDCDGDGYNDVITSSAHDYGIWWFRQSRDADGKITFTQHLIDKSFSQVHALKLVDINGDGILDFVCGKRYFAHNGNDPGAREPAVVHWFELRRPEKGKVEFVRHLIDNDSGLGTQFDVGDITGNGKPDIASANKKGVFIFTQK
ncbi:MAG: VCBS repeat-containing protein [Phycisphaerae bacterium]|nr:VCBS repeat-containing protein [Phycisphaerae bacterium]